MLSFSTNSSTSTYCLNTIPNKHTSAGVNVVRIVNGGRWLRQHGVTSAAEIAYYVDSVRSLLSSESADSYTQELLQLTTRWSQPFAEHFVSAFHPHMSSLGSWNLRAYGMESATTNQAESFNSVLKRLQAGVNYNSALEVEM